MTPSVPRVRALAVLFLSLALTSAAAQPLHVARVIDGDTFELSDGQRVRLIGIDTPEVHPSTKRRNDARRSGSDELAIRELGRRATLHAERLALGKQVELEYDQANSAAGHRDRYGRTLAYVHVVDPAGKRLYMVNARMVADGYASAYTRYPFARSAEFLLLQRTARVEGRGLWGNGSARSSVGSPHTFVQSSNLPLPHSR